MRILAALLLAGCAALPSPALVAETNSFVNAKRACRVFPCHPQFPTVREMAAAQALECTGYVMAKAYLLEAKGINRDRMTTFVFNLPRGAAHAVLVVDGEYVLDNLEPVVRRVSDYARFEPHVINVPWRS